MGKRRRICLTTEDAVRAKGQHKKPCSDCPFARASLQGWLGGSSSDDFLHDAQGEVAIECHVLSGAQCAGAAIYRGNVGKRPRDKSLLILPPDKDLVFSSPIEFKKHHERESE